MVRRRNRRRSKSPAAHQNNFPEQEDGYFNNTAYVPDSIDTIIITRRQNRKKSPAPHPNIFPKQEDSFNQKVPNGFNTTPSRSQNRKKKSSVSHQNILPEQEDSFRNFSLYPENEDIHSQQPKLNPIKINGAYRNVEHYLDVNFKVLREDFVNPLREGIRAYRQQSLTNDGPMNVNNIEVYKKVKFTSKDKVCFDVDNKITGVDWSCTKRFMTGSLLMFTSNNFESFFLATVANTELNELKKKMITVELIDKEQNKNLSNKTFTMVESDSFFTPYYHVLKTLQEFNETNFPFKKYLVDVDFKKRPPAYLDNFEKVYSISIKRTPVRFKVLVDSHWPTPDQLGLDTSQFEALKAALTNELVVIQGPPGTGKTFIGLKIVEVLLANSQVWNQTSTPILVVCFTNHALDQFLEAILSLTQKIVRVGKSDGGKLDQFNLREKRKQYSQSAPRFQTDNDLRILRSALVVGTTTTLAAKQRQLFSSLAPKIVIVEEAAEVLEAHILASLTEKCQHLVMIGDHKQLRPNVNEVQRAKQNKLDVSLFERLILNGMPYHMLSLQHRMRPEISQPLVRTIYPGLKNHPQVFKRDNIKGMDKNIFFLTHNFTEEQADGTSKKNDFEAGMLLNLASYLIKQGYKPQEITILATYKGQTNYLEEKRQCFDQLSEVQITTVDNYQGEENKIILLSLVRSNRENNIGFLKIDNRICVALSRARDGFFIVGNMNCLVARSHVWTVVKNTLIENQSYGTSLPVRCQKHKEKITLLARTSDFTAVAHGGCTSPCGHKFACGHTCKYRCHGPLQEQVAHTRCREPCRRVLCKEEHRCSKMCGERCDTCPCQIIASRARVVRESTRPSRFTPVYVPSPCPPTTVGPPRAPTEKKKWWRQCTLL